MSYQKYNDVDAGNTFAQYPGEKKADVFVTPTTTTALNSDPVQIGPNEPRWRDFLFVVAFWINFIAWFVVVGYSQNLVDLKAFDLVDKHTIFTYTPIVLVIGAFAMLFAAAANALAMRFPRQFGICSIIFQIIFTIGYLVFVCVQFGPQPYVIVIGVLVVAVFCWTLYNFYKYIDFAEQLVGVVRTVAGQQKGNYTAVIVGTAVLLSWVMIWSFAVMSVLPKWQGGSLYAVSVHSIFVFYWVSEVIRNVTHVTVCGSHAAWYFSTDNYRQSNPTLGAFRRAATYSFGSICFGSLLVAILQTLRRLFQLLRFGNSRNLVLLILSIIARIMLAIIEAILRFFNKYIYVIVAITGDNYWTCAKKAIELFGENGFEMVMQNNIVVSMISSSTIVAIFAAMGIAYGLGQAMALEVWACVAIGVVLAAFIVEGSFVLLESGSMSILMMFIMSPEKLRQSRPELYTLLSSVQGAPVRASTNV